jgi:uncharacterized protein YgiM (DUF1202 family)
MKKPFWAGLIALSLLTLSCSLSGSQAQNLGLEMATGTDSPLKTSEPPRASEPVQTVSEPSEPEDLYFVNAQAVNLRACAGLGCAVLDILTLAQLVAVSDTQDAPDGGAWAKVTTQAGQVGWVNLRFLTKEK